jgi:hypothetical protein
MEEGGGPIHHQDISDKFSSFLNKLRFARGKEILKRCSTKQTNVAIRRYRLLAMLICIFLYSRNASSVESDPPQGSLSYVDSQPLMLTLTSSGNATAYISVRNSGSNAANAEVCILLQNEAGQDCVGLARVVGTNAEVAPGQVKVLLIQISGVRAPISGSLGLVTRALSGKAVTISFRQLKINPSLLPQIVEYPIGIGLAVGLLVCVYSGLRLKNLKISMLTRMGTPTWDFSKSWASNITVATAFLSATLVVGGLPEQTRYIGRGGYGVLSVFLTILLGVAPLVFNLIRSPIINENSSNGPQLEFQGYVLTFLFACGITVLANTGQMVTLIILVNEFLPASLLPVTVVRTFQGMIGLLTIGIAWYAAKTIYWTAKCQAIERAHALTKISKAKGVTIDDLHDVHPPLSSWPLP